MTQFRYPPQQQQGFGPSSFRPPPGINHPPQDKQTDEMMKALMQSQISFIKQTKQAIGNSSGPSSLNPSLEEAKAITTLRSGKVNVKDLPPKQKSVPLPVLIAAPAIVPDLESVPEKEKVVVPAPAGPTTLSPPVTPYPNRLVVKPKFAKVLKDLCTLKWRTKSQDKLLLMGQVSSIHQVDIPTKCKDHGCPTIPIAIAGQKFDKALLDLGASVNLLPYSVCLRLGLGHLRATPVTLQLADRSVKVPKGVAEDVLIQVGEFIFLTDFIILDMCPIPKVFENTSIILGRPFLATSSAVMNSRTGKVQMLFGDLKMEMNVFNVDSRVEDDKKVYEDLLEIALTAEKASFLDSSEVGSLMEMLAVEDVYDAAWDPVLEPLSAPLS
ncbi:uncharacterized protein LOC131302896 [Rhododendron vialii]|uniref:uncharacterized protein LOC131302896 n=1 Tax=Rhododendron vialii TaxID=182163 RepID=UPI002660031A|nr:uncharacterized protein LOC131302896 [Rhododendron vialii]